MTELSLDRFRALADAYGGVIQRWPAAERDAAMRLAAVDPAARTLLEEALALDMALDDWVVAPPTPVLAGRLLAGAPKRRRGGLRLWWSGIGLAATLAGAAAGSVAAAVVVPSDQAADTATAFGDPGGQEG